MRLRNKLATTTVAGLLLSIILTPSVLAMCIWFVPPGRTFEPARNIKTLIVRDGDDTTLVVEPEFSGTADDFGLVMPFPSRPELSEAYEETFEELEDFTNPEFDFGPVFLEDSAIEEGIRSAPSVRVIEQRDVGDYTATTLTANNTQDLINWLDANGYEVSEENLETLDFYVDKARFFVALKVNLDKAKTDRDGVLQGALKPIQFDFRHKNAELPLRLMAGGKGLMTLTVYTVAEDILYIPGAEIQFSRKVTSSDIKDNQVLEEYNTWQSWLVRNVVQFDPSVVSDDLTLLTTRQDQIVTANSQTIVLNPDKLPLDSGIVVSENGLITYTDEKIDEDKSEPINDDSRESTPLWVATIILAIANVVLLIILSTNKPGTHPPEKEAKKT